MVDVRRLLLASCAAMFATMPLAVLAGGPNPQDDLPGWPVFGLTVLFLLGLGWAAWGTLEDLRTPKVPAVGPGGTGRPPVRHSLAGNILFLGSLVGFIVYSLSLLPCDYLDLWYLLDLEQGRGNPMELVHPLYLPVLVAYRTLLGWVGIEGRMLVPVEILNICIASIAHWLVYRLARRFSSDALAGAAATLVAMVGTGPWNAAVRPTPYAWGTLLVVLVAWICLAPGGLGTRSRVALAGLATGVTMGIHLSAMALVPAVLVCLVAENPRNLRAVGSLGSRYLRAVMATVLAEYGILASLHDLGVQRLLLGKGEGFGALYRTLEQEPGTALLTSRSLLHQVTIYFQTLGDCNQGLLILLAAALVVAVVLHPRSIPGWLREDRVLWITAATIFVGFAGFFTLNNARNGFGFASMILGPVLLARVVTRTRGLVWLILPIAAGLVGVGVLAMQGSAITADNDAMYVETRFLGEALRAQDVLVVPGCPYIELLYLKHVNVLGVTDRPVSAHDEPCRSPMVLADSSLLDRLAWYRSRGSRVLFTDGDLETDFTSDASGAEKRAQVFHGASFQASDRRDRARKVRDVLLERFTLQPGLSSPLDRAYDELESRDGVEPPELPVAPDGPDASSKAIPVRLREVGSRTRSLDIADLATYLQAWADAIPGDTYLLCDLTQALCARDSSNDPNRCPRVPGCTRNAALRDPASASPGPDTSSP